MKRIARSLLAACAVLAAGCGPKEPEFVGEVVVYTALDPIYSEPILARFEERERIKVLPVFDSEAAKTVGLANRIVAERERPRCDVFWNNEILRTIRLKREGVLAPYASPAAEGIPAPFKDPEGFWTGFAARTRVVAYNTDRVAEPDAPRELGDLTAARWQGRFAMAYPLFGTTATHAAVLFAVWGPEKAQLHFELLKENGVRIVDGNMTACRAAADGEVLVAATDTDDANLLRTQGKPIAWKAIDHEGAGAVPIPNTVALVAGAPNAVNAKKLIDYLLSAEVEAALAASPSLQIPLRPGVEAPADVLALAETKWLPVDFEAAADQVEPSAKFLESLFAKP